MLPLIGLRILHTVIMHDVYNMSTRPWPQYLRQCYMLYKISDACKAYAGLTLNCSKLTDASILIECLRSLSTWSFKSE